MPKVPLIYECTVVTSKVKGATFTRINSGGIWAVEGVLVSVEADVSDGLPGFSMVRTAGFREVRESPRIGSGQPLRPGFRLPG